MTDLDPVYEKYICIAIQTVLQRNRNQIHLLMDTDKYLPFVKDISREIIVTAKTYHKITESTILEMEQEQQQSGSLEDIKNKNIYYL